MKRPEKIYMALLVIVMSLVILFLKVILQDKTEIETVTFVREQSTSHTVYYNGTYFYYDKSKEGICSKKNEQEKFLFKVKDPWGIAANRDFIYTICSNGIQQYEKNGKLIAQYKGDSYDDIYASEEYVYCVQNEDIVILSSNDITEPVKKEIQTEDIKRDIEYVDQESGKENTINYGSLDMGTELLVWSWFSQDGFQPRIRRSGAGICIGEKCTVVSKKTGNPLVRSRFNPLNFKNSIAIEGETIWEITERISKKDERKEEELIDLGENVIVLPTGNGTAYVDNGMLCVAGSLFEAFPLPFSSHSSSANGPMNQQKREILRYFDINQSRSLKDYDFSKGSKVVYADKEGFILYHNGNLEFYNAEDGSLKKKVKMKVIKKNETYTVELCYHKLFFYHEGEVVEIVNVK